MKINIDLMTPFLKLTKPQSQLKEMWIAFAPPPPFLIFFKFNLIFLFIKN